MTIRANSSSLTSSLQPNLRLPRTPTTEAARIEGNEAPSATGAIDRVETSPTVTPAWSRLTSPITSEAIDLATFAISPVFTLLRRGADLLMVQLGWTDPDDDSRLGAYQATLGHERHTVGRGANNSIGGIYMLLGRFGQDQIGNVFHSEQAQQTLADSVDSASNGRLAQVEYDYWQSQWEQKQTAGGFLGTKVDPPARSRLQSWLSRL